MCVYNVYPDRYIYVYILIILYYNNIVHFFLSEINKKIINMYKCGYTIFFMCCILKRMYEGNIK